MAKKLKLYKAKIKMTVCFMSTPRSLELDARKAVISELEGNGFFKTPSITRVSKLRDLPSGWKKAVPWNTHNDEFDTSCVKIVKKEKA